MPFYLPEVLEVKEQYDSIRQELSQNILHHVRSNQLKITFAEPRAYFAVVACHHREHDSVADDHYEVAKRKEG